MSFKTNCRIKKVISRKRKAIIVTETLIESKEDSLFSSWREFAWEVDVERYIYIYIYIGGGGETIAPVYSPTTAAIHSVSVAPCPPHQPRALMYEVEKVCVQSSSEFLIVGPRDSCRLIVSWLFINGELVSPSFTFTYARLAITLNDARAIS